MTQRRVLPRAGRRSAFTLVELLVVIAIIGILIALLLPAVQAAREAARRMQCTNNLKQIGLALHNYHDTFKCFPPGIMEEAEKVNGIPNGDTPSWAQNQAAWGWMAFLLPYIEQKPLQDQLDIGGRTLELVINNATDSVLVQTPIESLICPSGRCLPINDGHLLNPDSGSPIRAGTSSYPGCAGTNWWNGFLPRRAQGHATQKPCTRFSLISDGTSNVFAVGERRWGNNAAIWPGVDSFGDGSGGYEDQNYVLGQADIKPNPPTGAARNFTSEHPDGCNFCLVDGSVRFINEAIDSHQDSDGDYDPDVAPGAAGYTPPGTYQLMARRDDGWPLKGTP